MYENAHICVLEGLEEKIDRRLKKSRQKSKSKRKQLDFPLLKRNASISGSKQLASG